MDAVFLSATQQLQLLRSKQLSPADLAEQHIAQIQRLNPLLHALVDFDPDRVRAQARAVRPGRLSGLPITIKSSIATSGYRCEIGSLLHRDHRPAHDARAVHILREQGAIVLGTTNCPELLMAYETDNLLHGRTANPWSLDHSAGGSSGGEAAAIAACMSAAGLGSDSGGSVRQPAHATGICALKPTSGRISAEGHLPPCVGPFSKLGAVGPMARSIEDVSLLFNVLAEGSANDPAHVPVPLRTVTLAEARQTTIGWMDGDDFGPVTPETRAAVRAAVATLQRAGFRVEPFSSPLLEQARQLWTTFFVQCGAMFYGPLIEGRETQLSPIFTDFLKLAREQTPLRAQTLLEAWAEWDLLCHRLLEQMRQCPILLSPVCAVPAFRHGERMWQIGGAPLTYLEAMRFMQWFNVLGAPAAVVPVASSPEGLPIGVQIAGAPYDDERVLAIAGILDAEFGYHHPPLATGSSGPGQRP